MELGLSPGHAPSGHGGGGTVCPLSVCGQRFSVPVGFGSRFFSLMSVLSPAGLVSCEYGWLPY